MSDPVALKAAVHVHSRYSDGTGTVDEITQAAHAAGVDVVVLGDHDTLAARDHGQERWHDDVLVVAGAEISPKRDPHCMALRTKSVEGLKNMSERDYLDRIARDGGLAFVAHAQGRGSRAPAASEHWADPGWTGVEVWSFMHDWIDGLRPWSFPRFYKHPFEQITGPAPEVMRAWDEVGRRRRFVGLGTLDAHAKQPPIIHFVTVFPYEFIFRTVLTYVLAEPLARDAGDPERFCAAVQAGHAYICYEHVGDGTGFAFRCDAPEGACIMGDEITMEPGQHLRIDVPDGGDVRLLCDGATVAGSRTDALEHDVAGPGVYRAEVTRDGKPWIFSNPIYVREKKEEGKR